MAPIVRIKGGIKGDLCEIWKKINEVHLECWCEASSIDQLVAEIFVRCLKSTVLSAYLLSK